MENLIELLQNNKEFRKQARQLIALAVGEMAEKRNSVSFDDWFNKNVREAKTSDENAALPLHGVSNNEAKICEHCGKYKRLQGNGMIHQLCECGSEVAVCDCCDSENTVTMPCGSIYCYDCHTFNKQTDC